MRVNQPDLFAAATPAGFVYAEDFLSRAEEAELLLAFRELPFEEARLKGVTAAPRRGRLRRPLRLRRQRARAGAADPGFSRRSARPHRGVERRARRALHARG